MPGENSANGSSRGWFVWQCKETILWNCLLLIWITILRARWDCVGEKVKAHANINRIYIVYLRCRWAIHHRLVSADLLELLGLIGVERLQLPPPLLSSLWSSFILNITAAIHTNDQIDVLIISNLYLPVFICTWLGCHLLSLMPNVY